MRDLAKEFDFLIEEHQSLRNEYASLLDRFPGPIPEPLVPVEITPSGPQPLSDEEQRAYEAREVERAALLAVHLPFMRAYWQPNEAGPSHLAANEWRRRFSSVMKRLERSYVLLRRRSRLDDFPLLRASGYGGDKLVDALDTHLELLALDRDDLYPQQSNDIGARLRKARKLRGDKQEAVAERVGCDVSTVSRIERGRQRPDESLRVRIDEYIRS